MQKQITSVIPAVVAGAVKYVAAILAAATNSDEARPLPCLMELAMVFREERKTMASEELMKLLGQCAKEVAATYYGDPLWSLLPSEERGLPYAHGRSIMRWEESHLYVEVAWLGTCTPGRFVRVEIQLQLGLDGLPAPWANDHLPVVVMEWETGTEVPTSTFLGLPSTEAEETEVCEYLGQVAMRE